MEKTFNGQRRKRGKRFQTKNGFNSKLDLSRTKDGGYLDQTRQQVLKWDLPLSNPTIPRQASLESSEEEEWSDLSFYDLPVTLKESFHRSAHPKDFISPSQMVSRPPYHATAKAHHIHTFLDAEVSNPFSSAMEHPANQSPDHDLLGHSQGNSSRSAEQDRVGNNWLASSGHQTNVSKAFDGSLYYRQSNVMLNGKQRVERISREPQRNGYHDMTTRSASSVKIKTPSIVVSPELSMHNTSLPDHSSANRDSEPATYLERLKRSFPSNASMMNSGFQGTVHDKFLQRSRESVQKREKQDDDVRHKKEHSPKSVSFASSVKDVDKPSKSDSLERGSSDKHGALTDVTAMPRARKVQSNVAFTEGLRSDLVRPPRAQNVDSRERIDPKPRQHMATMERKYFDSGEENIPLPPSPPTRDTNGVPNDHHSNSSSVQVLSLYDEKSSFASNLSQSSNRFPRQSNVNLSFDRGSTGSLLPTKRDQLVQLSNSKVDFSPNNSLRSSGDAKLTIEELLSSGSVNSSPENSPPAKSISQFSRENVSTKKEHSLDDYDDERGYLQELSFRNSFSVDTSQRISSALWAMKLLEASRTSNANSYQELLVKGRLFRRWYQKTRLKRLIKQEDEVKLQSAVTFWQTEMRHKCFVAWRNARSAQQEKADQLRRKQMLQKGLNALQFAVTQQRQSIVELQTRTSARVMAKYWLKWQKCVQIKVSARLKEAFDRWHVFKVNQNRETMMEGMADRHVLSRNYTKWKVKYETEQKSGLASLHFKIGLLTKSWHCWRLYSTQRIVKTRLEEVARVHYEEQLQARMFAVWKDNTKKAVVAHSVASKRVVVKAFYCWKNWTQYAKIIRLRFQSMCKEYHRHKLVKNAFHHWQIRLMNRRADKRYSSVLQRKIFKLWFLRYKRKVIHRHLCRALAKKGKKRRFFNRWSSYTRQQIEKRKAFVGTLERMLASIMLNNWKEHVKLKKSLRDRLHQLTEKKNQLASRRMMDRWLFAIKVVNFRKKARLNWSRRCTRKAYEAWKILLKRKYLEERLLENRRIWERLFMKRIFKKWRHQKRQVDAENEKVFRAQAILARNHKARVLQAWRVVNQEQQIISPMVARRERKELARVFDAWRLHVHRQKHIVDQKTRTTEKILDKHFLFWRERAYLRIKEREVKETLLESKLSRAFNAWRAFIKEQRHNRVKVRARKFQLMEKYYSAWKNKVQVKAEEKIEETGKEARNALLVRWSFRYWRRSAEQQKTYRLLQQETADQFYKTMIIKEAWAVWVRRYRVEEWARDHARARKEGFLRKLFQAWRGFIKETLQLEMQHFATSLSGLDSSFGSFTAPPFRNVLGSTFGSTFGSTLGSPSPTMSDALTSSGYGVSMRRGSGSVFTFGVLPKERDDDTASLPGRIDQINHLLRPGSPQNRPISPISILRDSRPVSPLVFNSNHTSPTPSPSPERDPYPPTPPIRYQDFSPVKSEDDTGIHSGSSESDHEDDRMSTASCTSFTGRSTQSEMRDRELMATETIIHWRNLPLSLTFRTWLKYTRQRKLQRELLNYLTNNKTMDLMVKTLATWRRELYTRVTARQHWLYTSRLKCLRVWHEYADSKRIQEDMKSLADKHRRLTLLKGRFQKWKKRCTSKKKLQALIGQWQKKAFVTEEDKSSTQVIQKKQKARFVRHAFYYWAKMTTKSQEAKRLYMERLLPKCFVAWHVLASTRVTNRRNVVLFGERRLLVMAFREWQARFQAVSLVDEFIELKETDRLLEVLRGWHAWANGMSTQRKQARLFRRSVELKIMKEIFTEWLNGAQQLQLARRTHAHNIMRSVFVCWKDVALERTRNRRAMHDFKKHAASNLLARSFRFWQQLHGHSEVSRAHSQQRDQNQLRECFQEWRDYTLEIRADKYYVIAIQKKIFFWWYDEYTSRKTTRRLIHTWKSITEEAKVLNTRAMHIAEDSEKKLLRRLFDYWVQEAHKVQKAKNHAHDKLMRSTLLGLRQYVHCRAERRQALQDIHRNKAHQLLLNSFKTWRESFQRNVKNLEILEEYLEKKDTELLHHCLVKWMKFMLRCKAEKSYQKKLVVKSFQRWWLALYTKKGSEKLQEKILLRRTRDAGLHWKHWTYKVKKQAEMADNLQTRHGRRLVHSYFHLWTDKTRQMQRAREFHDQTLLKRSLVEWRKVIRKRIDERNTIKSFQDQLMNKKISRMFYEWRDALKLARKHKKLVEGQMVHHSRRMKQGVLKEWKKFTLTSRAEKHYNNTVTSKFFAEWKAKAEQKLADKEKEKQQDEIAGDHYKKALSKLCFRAWLHDTKLELYRVQKDKRNVVKHFTMWKKRIALNTIATELVDRRVYEKFWTKWRHQLIRKRVSQMMMKHEEKKQLSEVFLAWYQLTLVNRRLLKEWQIYKTKKVFRLWMQKYNES